MPQLESKSPQQTCRALSHLWDWTSVAASNKYLIIPQHSTSPQTFINHQVPWLQYNTWQQSHGPTGTTTILYQCCTHHLPSRGSSVPWEGGSTGKHDYSWLFPKQGPLLLLICRDSPLSMEADKWLWLSDTSWHSSKGYWYQPKICEDNCWCQELYWSVGFVQLNV